MKWVHDDCDPEYQNAFKNLERDKYLCPLCRIKVKRKVYVELINCLSVFDEFQYFTEPTYEKIPFYHQIIANPMCFGKMKELAQDGTYDYEPFKRIEKDFQLLVSNALKFNMPKEMAHVQAKILKILGEKGLKKFKECFEPDLRELLSG